MTYTDDYELDIQNEASKEYKRSKVYIRDNGICDICKKFVLLKDYELGHIIDKANGGDYNLSNLVTMHRDCNRNKPLHNSIEEYTKWKLTRNAYVSKSTIKLPKPPKEQISFINPNNNPTTTISQISASKSTPVLVPIIKPKKQPKYDKKEWGNNPAPDGTIQFRQGKVWVIIIPPYTENNVYKQGRPLSNSKPIIYTGKGSANKTIQIINGDLDHDINVNMGWNKALIYKEDNTLKIKFSGGTEAINKRWAQIYPQNYTLNYINDSG